MLHEEKEIIITIIGGAGLMFAFCLIIILSILRYQKKQKLFIAEKLMMQNHFQQELLKANLEIKEETFNAISSEIHDNVGQILSLAKVQLNIIDQSKISEIPLLPDVKENITKAMADLRDIAKGLSSNRLAATELKEVIEDELRRINKSGVLAASMEVHGTEKKLAPQKKLIVYRIVQESIQNILKHADASKLFIVFNYFDPHLEITIQDNGSGFNLAEQKKGTGLGLQNIRNRAELIGGNADIISTIHMGTTIKITIPYE